MTKRLLTIIALLLLVPVAFWLTGWHWQGSEVPLARPLWLITQTAGSPVAFASIIALTALLCYSHRRGETRALLLVVLISLGAGAARPAGEGAEAGGGVFAQGRRAGARLPR